MVYIIKQCDIIDLLINVASEVTSPPSPTPLAIPLANSISKEDYPIVDGSTATIPLSEAVYRLATGATAEEAATDIVHTKTSNSYYRLMWGEADLLMRKRVIIFLVMEWTSRLWISMVMP